MTKLEAECLAQRLGDHQYVETSSVTGQNIEKSVQMMAEVVYRNVIDGFYEEVCHPSPTMLNSLRFDISNLQVVLVCSDINIYEELFRQKRYT